MLRRGIRGTRTETTGRCNSTTSLFVLINTLRCADERIHALPNELGHGHTTDSCQSLKRLDLVLSQLHLGSNHFRPPPCLQFCFNDNTQLLRSQMWLSLILGFWSVWWRRWRIRPHLVGPGGIKTLARPAESGR